MPTLQIPLTRGKTTVIDTSDAKLVLRYRWHAHLCRDHWYARTKTADGHIYLHRLLLEAKTGEIVDHRNGDGLDNQRGNLRLCSQAQNAQNRNKPKRNSVSGFIGVGFDRARGRWIGFVRHNGRNVWFARFDSAEEAARARDAVALREFGAFAGLNFPESVHDDDEMRDLPGFGAV